MNEKTQSVRLSKLITLTVSSSWLWGCVMSECYTLAVVGCLSGGRLESDRVMVVCAVWRHQRRLSGNGVVHDHDAEDVPCRPGHSACGQPHPKQHRHLLPEVSGFFLLTAHCGRASFLMRQVVVGHRIKSELGSVLTQGHSHWAPSQMVMRSKARLDCRPLLLSG